MAHLTCVGRSTADELARRRRTGSSGRGGRGTCSPSAWRPAPGRGGAIRGSTAGGLRPRHRPDRLPAREPPRSASAPPATRRRTPRPRRPLADLRFALDQGQGRRSARRFSRPSSSSTRRTATGRFVERAPRGRDRRSRSCPASCRSPTSPRSQRFTKMCGASAAAGPAGAPRARSERRPGRRHGHRASSAPSTQCRSRCSRARAPRPALLHAQQERARRARSSPRSAERSLRPRENGRAQVDGGMGPSSRPWRPGGPGVGPQLRAPS